MKRILFICGSLEPGKDGVGDYTRLLASEIIKLGGEASIVALNDKDIKGIKEQEQVCDNVKIWVQRNSNELSWRERTKFVKSFIDNYNPDVVSLQYVPYSFNKKGLPLLLIFFLKKVVVDRRSHIMFHELWIGMDKSSQFKNRIMGFFQKQIIIKLLREFKPKLIHTHSELYKHQLQRIAPKYLEISKLPLFGNIPFASIVNLEKNISELNFVIFGNIHYQSNLILFIKWLHKTQTESKKKLVLQFIGKNGNEQQKWIDLLETFNLEYKVHGIQSTKYISELFQKCDISISTTPYYLVEKSGSVAAVLEHGLPVICVAREWIPRVSSLDIIKPKLNLIEFKKGLSLNEIFSLKMPKYTLQSISSIFMDDVNKKIN